MHIKTAVHELTQRLHRLGWRTERALDLLAQWRSSTITQDEFHSRVDELTQLDHEDLTSDELADLDLFLKVLAQIKQQAG